MKYFYFNIYALQIFAAYLLPLVSTARISQTAVITPSSSYQSSFSGIPNYDVNDLKNYFYTTRVIFDIEHQQPIGPFFGYFPNLLSPCSPCPSCPATQGCPDVPSTCPETPTYPSTTPTTSTTTTPTTSITTEATTTSTTAPTSTTTSEPTTTAVPPTCPTCPSCMTCPTPTTPTTCPPVTTTTNAPLPTCPTCPSCMTCPATTISTTSEPTTTAAPPTCPTCPSCMTCPAPTTQTTCPPVTTTTTFTTTAPPTCPTCPSCTLCPVPPPPETITTCDNGLNSSVSAAPNGRISVDNPTPDVNLNCVYGFVAYPPNTRIVVKCNSLSAGARFWLSKAIPVAASVVGIDYTSKTSHLIMTANNLLNKIGIKLDCTWRAIP
uniref:Uncharacterized protein n=1 Tax=Daphnia galeata TaxID=27404 RepID=A0A8J2RPK4_9CRUS|nr:unnamed protein product [Daphnia galeata]